MYLGEVRAMNDEKLLTVEIFGTMSAEDKARLVRDILTANDTSPADGTTDIQKYVI